jgi:hypothetical protein
MFEKFGENLYRSRSYVLEEIIPGRQYLTKHVRSETREKWCKVSYRVDVSESGDEYIYECGNFEHSGLLCSHALKVWHTNTNWLSWFKAFIGFCLCANS